MCVKPGKIVAAFFLPDQSMRCAGAQQGDDIINRRAHVAADVGRDLVVT
jgi:hypothetical protein